MSRVLPTAIVLALLAATAVAFVITEGAKLEKSPIAGTKVTPLFSQNGVQHRTAHVQFRLRTRERLEAWIEDARGDRVRELQAARTFPRGARLDLVWDGFTSSGIAEPDGVYMPVVKLLRSHRTIVLPSPIRIDTKPPVITVRHPLYPLLSPDGDGRRDSFTVPYRINERAHGILSVRGGQVEFTRSQKQTGELHWNGKLGKPPKAVLPGRYLLTVSAQDEAENRSKPFPFAIAQVRYLALGRDRVVVRPRGKFALRVSTDYPSVQWKLRGRSGVQRTGTLHFRAPRSIGVFRLFITAGRHSAKCTVVVA
ncbi:MAG: hypothetical protein HOQ28_11970 [Thermoleophilia bacterium]|nr:hypothetical protein [Thermoleophilia bacterium]